MSTYWTPRQHVIDCGWDYSCIEATAERGISDEDSESLTPTQQVALLLYCRARVAAESESEDEDEEEYPLQLTPIVTRVGDAELVVAGRKAVGFGMGAGFVARHDRVALLPTDLFNRYAASLRPSGYQEYGFNFGAPVDGLTEIRGVVSGIRYLVCATGAGMTYEYADAATVPSEPPAPAPQARRQD